MTTIAWRARDGVLAADTRFSQDDGAGVIYAPKIVRIGAVLVGFSGPFALGLRFFSWVATRMEGPSPYELADGGHGGNGIIVSQAGVVFWGGLGPWPIRDPIFALGSGEYYAMGALAAGASPAKAVRIASRYDTGTGGKITVLKL